MSGKMIDLKLSAKEKKQAFNMVPMKASSSDLPDYPYWASLHFDKETIKKLKMCEVRGGEEVEIRCVARVSDIHLGDENQVESMGIQIQKMEIMPMEDAKKKMRKEVAKEVYG